MSFTRRLWLRAVATAGAALAVLPVVKNLPSVQARVNRPRKIWIGHH
jgi:hypothetical protein